MTKDQLLYKLACELRTYHKNYNLVSPEIDRLLTDAFNKGWTPAHLCPVCYHEIIPEDDRCNCEEVELRQQVHNLQTELDEQMIIKVIKPSPLATALAELDRIREEADRAKKSLVEIAQAEIKAAFLAGLAGWSSSGGHAEDVFDVWRKGRAFQQ